MKKIKFISQNKKCGTEIEKPKPSSSYVPQWYKNAHRYLKLNGEPGSKKDVMENKADVTFKNCAPLFDSITAGYMLETICNLEIYKEEGVTKIKTEPGYEWFVNHRGPSPSFDSSDQWEPDHFSWYSPWSIKLPDGYSALYVSPLNRTDIPIFTISGIIDNDKMSITGQYPFLIKKDFIGIIKKGTPFVQIIPFFRDSWESEIEIQTEENIAIEIMKPFKYRKRKVNYYKENEWHRKLYI